MLLYSYGLWSRRLVRLCRMILSVSHTSTVINSVNSQGDLGDGLFTSIMMSLCLRAIYLIFCCQLYP